MKYRGEREKDNSGTLAAMLLQICKAGGTGIRSAMVGLCTGVFAGGLGILSTMVGLCTGVFATCGNSQLVLMVVGLAITIGVRDSISCWPLGLTFAVGGTVETVQISHQIFWTLPYLERGLLLLLIDVYMAWRHRVYDADANTYTSYIFKGFILGVFLVVNWSQSMLGSSCCGAENIGGDDSLMCHAQDGVIVCRVLPLVGHLLFVASAWLHYWAELARQDHSVSLLRQTPLWRLTCVAGRLVPLFIGYLAPICLIPVIAYVIITIAIVLIEAFVIDVAVIIAGTYIGLLVDYVALKHRNGSLLGLLLVGVAEGAYSPLLIQATTTVILFHFQVERCLS
jgi:hypothetical protein